MGAEVSSLNKSKQCFDFIYYNCIKVRLWVKQLCKESNKSKPFVAHAHNRRQHNLHTCIFYGAGLPQPTDLYQDLGVYVRSPLPESIDLRQDLGVYLRDPLPQPIDLRSPVPAPQSVVENIVVDQAVCLGLGVHIRSPLVVPFDLHGHVAGPQPAVRRGNLSCI